MLVMDLALQSPKENDWRKKRDILLYQFIQVEKNKEYVITLFLIMSTPMSYCFCVKYFNWVIL